MQEQSSVFSADSALREQLEKRSKEGSLRSLPASHSGLIDFASNDYLGFSRSIVLNKLIADERAALPKSVLINGSTGSRLLTGNSAMVEELEKSVANFHGADAALIYNSGYAANTGLFSCIARRNDTILYDELSHASIIDGIRLSFANTYKFRHNDMEHLKELLLKAKGMIYIAVESVYSMDGDQAPLKELTALAKQFGANLIVDEAHATGVCGRKGEGLVNELGLEQKVFARIHTFGKALGIHGAAISGSQTLKEFLINFSRPFIYTTALPPASLIEIKCAYQLLEKSTALLNTNRKLISFFQERVKQASAFEYIESDSCIQALIVGDNQKAKQLAEAVREKGYDVRAILSPTVPKGKERLRLCLHTFNSEEQIIGLLQSLRDSTVC